MALNLTNKLVSSMKQQQNSSVSLSSSTTQLSSLFSSLIPSSSSQQTMDTANQHPLAHISSDFAVGTTLSRSEISEFESKCIIFIYLFI